MSGYFGLMCMYCLDVFQGHVQHRDSKGNVLCATCWDKLLAALQAQHQTLRDIQQTELEVEAAIRQQKQGR